MGSFQWGFAPVDWAVLALYFAITISIGLWFSRRASRGVAEFFLAGRKLVWWMAGGSMVATMFASDTPLFHCGNVREGGLSAGWIFLFPMFGALLAAAVFAPLVRRTGVVTDAEYIELRYSGRFPGPFRAFQAIYFGLFIASLILAWVTKGMQQTATTIMGLDGSQQTLAVVVLLAVVTTYAMASGLWGVVATDLFQYLIASFGSVYLAVAAIHACGGVSGLQSGLARIQNYSGSDMHFLPTFSEFSRSTGELMLGLPLIIAWILVQGAGQASSAQHQGQRILACRSTRDASLTYVFYSFCYYILNGVPWFITGLASMVILGSTNQVAGLDASEQAFPAMIKSLMPAGLMGLMVAALVAAFMSTVSVLLNWGGSFLVNDIYRRFVIRGASEKHYVWISRLASLLIALIGGFLCVQFKTLTNIMIEVPPLMMGATFIYLFRMLWWRINIWSEISAYIASPLIGAYVQFVMGGSGPSWLSDLPGYGIWSTPAGHTGWETYGWRLLAPALGTTLVFVIVALLTPPTDLEKLKSFYLKVRPPGPGWRQIRLQIQNPPPVDRFLHLLAAWAASILFLIGSLMTVIDFIRLRSHLSILWLAAAVAGWILMNRGLGATNQAQPEPEGGK